MASQNTQTELATDLNTASRLEAQLKALSVSNTKTEGKASELRIKLCEVFSDVLLSDCTTALRKDVTGRLWYSCFYNRIQELRQRITKEKSRSKKQKATGVSTADGGKERIKNAEDSLKTFIQEGITLYNFLVDRLQGSLIPGQSQSQNSDVSQAYSKGTVPSLHKLYIHLGDMHRYASSFPDAETAYLQASKLAPSKGNPYNQMAVVAQLKESNGFPLPAMALYWYCRSLCSKEVFETSKSNVERLFSANEKWLLKNGTEFDGESPSLVDTLSGSDKEQGKQIKSAASRMVLSRFVAFHGSIFLSQREDLNDSLLFSRFREILDVNPFGDGLMMKLVTINIFSAWSTAEAKSDLASPSYVFLIEFAKHMCESMESILEKTEVKIEKGSKTTNIRLLSPLLLTCEFLSHEICKDNSILKACAGDDLIQRIFYEFWSSLGKVATKITSSKPLSEIINIQTVRSDACALPDDFKSLAKGCRPFNFLDKVKKSGSDGENWAYVDQEEAVEALGLNVTQTQSQMSQRSKKSSATDKTSVASEAENRIKLARFMSFLTKHIQSGELVKSEEGIIEAAPILSENKDTIDVQDNESTMDFESSYPETVEASPITSLEKRDDVLVYKQAEKGQPVLLVPSAFLLGDAEEEKVEDMDDGSGLLKLSAMIDSNMKKKQNSSPLGSYESKDENMPFEPPMPSKPVPLVSASAPVRPPPGFQSSNFTLPTPANPVLQARAFPSLPSDGRMQNPSLSTPPHQSEQNSRILPPGFGPPAASTFHMPQTRNPFASRLNQSYGVNPSSISAASPLMNGRYFNNELPLDSNNANDLGLTDQDPFGLRALGIFSDEAPTLETNSFHQHPATRNPFHFD
jgi:hypothetical protein